MGLMDQVNNTFIVIAVLFDEFQAHDTLKDFEIFKGNIKNYQKNCGR